MHYDGFRTPGRRGNCAVVRNTVGLLRRRTPVGIAEGKDEVDGVRCGYGEGGAWVLREVPCRVESGSKMAGGASYFRVYLGAQTRVMSFYNARCLYSELRDPLYWLLFIQAGSFFTGDFHLRH
jgi:hypothetical protein